MDRRQYWWILKGTSQLSPRPSVTNKYNSIRRVKEQPGKWGDHSVSVTRFWVWWQSNKRNKDGLIMKVHKQHLRQSEKHVGMRMSCCHSISLVVMRSRDWDMKFHNYKLEKVFQAMSCRESNHLEIQTPWNQLDGTCMLQKYLEQFLEERMHHRPPHRQQWGLSSYSLSFKYQQQIHQLLQTCL